MAKHNAPQPVRWWGWLGVGFLALLLVAGGIGLLRMLGDDAADDPVAADPTSRSTGADDRAQGATGEGGSGRPPDCAPVTVWSAPELLPAVESAAARAAEQEEECFSYAVVPRETATSSAALREGEEPDVWLPSSLAWAQLAAEAGVQVEVGETVATSPVLLAGRAELVAGLDELGVSADSTFVEVVQQYQQAATSGGGSELALRLGDPRTDPASMALLGSTADQLGELAEPGSPGRNLLVLLAQTSIQDDPLAAALSDPATLVPATEQQLGRAVAEGEALQGVALQGGVGTVILPFVRVADTGSADAVDALEEQLVSEEAADDLLELFLRPGTGGEAPDVAGVPEDVAVEAEAPAPEVSGALAEVWAVIAPQSRILTLIDISGSMEAAVGDTTRIDLTRESAQGALAVLPGQTAVGLWYFATALDGERDYEPAAPLRPLSEEVRSNIPHREVLLAEIEDLGLESLQGDTGLHDALWAAYQFMQEDYRPDAISSVLLLTDGMNDDPTGGLSEDEVVRLLAQAREADDRPVTVVLIGMGPDVDEEALGRLAEAAGGESFVLRDPRDLPQMFVDVVARRAP